MLYGGTGDDDLVGGAGNDRLYGGGGSDDLIGGTGNDRLYGQNGDDTLAGGAGNDQLDGGAGRDHYVWQSGETGTDTVRGYSLAPDGDVLNLADLLDGDPDAPDELDAYLDFGYRRGATEVRVDAQGDASGVDQVIRLAGVDLTDGGSLTDEEIITQLLANNQIVG